MLDLPFHTRGLPQVLRAKASWMRVESDTSLSADNAVITSCEYDEAALHDRDDAPADHALGRGRKGWNFEARGNALRFGKSGLAGPLADYRHAHRRTRKPLFITNLVAGQQRQVRRLGVRATVNLALGSMGMGAGVLFGGVMSLPTTEHRRALVARRRDPRHARRAARTGARDAHPDVDAAQDRPRARLRPRRRPRPGARARVRPSGVAPVGPHARAPVSHSTEWIDLASPTRPTRPCNRSSSRATTSGTSRRTPTSTGVGRTGEVPGAPAPRCAWRTAPMSRSCPASRGTWAGVRSRKLGPISSSSHRPARRRATTGGTTETPTTTALPGREPATTTSCAPTRAATRARPSTPASPTRARRPSWPRARRPGARASTPNVRPRVRCHRGCGPVDDAAGSATEAARSPPHAAPPLHGDLVDERGGPPPVPIDAVEDELSGTVPRTSGCARAGGIRSRRSTWTST